MEGIRRESNPHLLLHRQASYRVHHRHHSCYDDTQSVVLVLYLRQRLACPSAMRFSLTRFRQPMTGVPRAMNAGNARAWKKQSMQCS